MDSKKIINFIRDIYSTKEEIPLHSPSFKLNETKYVLDSINSTFVSSFGKYVDEFEQKIEKFTGSVKAVAVVNGTAALHTALYMAGIKRDEFVITQALTFVATCNALYHMGAKPIFVDVSIKSLGLCPQALELYLNENATLTDDGCIHSKSGKKIKAVLPMHTFGHPVELDEISRICKKWNLVMIEDAAESLGSFYKGRHTGTIGDYGALSFNGNKIITTGGGGMVLCASRNIGIKVKHITTTAKVPHQYEFFHDEPGFNYRLPNINAALGVAQMESLESYLCSKRKLAEAYKLFFSSSDIKFFVEPEYAKSNYWLNAVICSSIYERNQLLRATNSNGISTRPIWMLMYRLPMFSKAFRGNMKNSEFIEAHLVNLPSSPLVGL